MKIPRDLLNLDRLQAEMNRRFPSYQDDPLGYASDCLGVSPWRGEGDEPGQAELFEAIAESVRMQLAGGEEALRAARWFKAQAGHGVGKTFGCACLVNWFFDCFPPAIVLTTAPSVTQVEKLLWKDIKKLRPSSFPGVVLPTAPEMRKKDRSDWFAFGTTTTDANGQGTERFQGQHGPFLLFILDEAEGIQSWVYDSINAMMTGGGVVLCVMIGNPRTRTSRFYKIENKKHGVRSFRFDCLCHPNVVRGEDMIPGAVSRRWVDEMIDEHCEPVPAHSEDEYTFEVAWRPGVIYLPDDEFLFRVRGIAPPNATDKTLIPPGRFEAATKRAEPLFPRDLTHARLGIDAARDGTDHGTIWLYWGGVASRVAKLSKKKTGPYVGAVKEIAAELKAAGVKSLHIRVDGGGGYGGGVIDRLVDDMDFCGWFDDLRIFEVHFGSPAHDAVSWGNLITELYADTGESLKGIAVIDPPEELEEDLTSRQYEWRNKSGVEVRVLEEKKAFKKRMKRSPDDGDGFVLAVASPRLFVKVEQEEIVAWEEPMDSLHVV